MEKLPLSKAITAGMRKAMEDDPKVVLIGEDIGKLGGVFRVTEGLQKDFGPQRVIDAPLAESGIVGTSIGMAIRGYRPVIEIQFDAFIFPAYDQSDALVVGLDDGGVDQERDAMAVRAADDAGSGSREHQRAPHGTGSAHRAGPRRLPPT